MKNKKAKRPGKVVYTVPSIDHPNRKVMDKLCDRIADFIDARLKDDKVVLVVDSKVRELTGHAVNEIHIPTLRWRLHLRHPGVDVHVARAYVEVEYLSAPHSWDQITVVVGGPCRLTDQWGSFHNW